jgi:hypothetical protein
MQRHRDHAIGVVQERCATGAHHRTEPSRQGPPTLILESVDDFPERSFVFPGAAADGDRPSAPAATWADLRGNADYAPRRQRVATRPTEGRRKRSYCRPALHTDWSGGGSMECAGACRTSRSKRDRQHCVSQLTPCPCQIRVFQRCPTNVPENRNPGTRG